MSEHLDSSAPQGPADRPALHLRLLRQMHIHQLIFVLVIGPLNLFNYIQGAPWWAIWPSMIWGVLLTIHVCIVRSITVDEAWVDARALELREHSYDFDHMRDVERRITDSDFSVVPPEEQRSKKSKRSP
jgi:hypothetical protein